MKYLTLVFFIFLFSACKNDYAVERSIEIDAPKELVWEQIKYFKKWQNWSPWYANDSTMEITYEGTDGNVESAYSWTSENSGSGTIKNIGLTESEELLYHTQFFEPWKSESDGYLRLSETADGKTQVKWGFTGVNKGITSLFLNMDELVGPDFEQGLALLKTYTEKIAADVPKIQIEEINFEGKTYVAVREKIGIASIQSFYATNFSKIKELLGVEIENGYPTGIYYTWDMENMQSDMAAAIPVAKGVKAPKGTTLIELPASKALLINYYGDYKTIGTAHELMESYLTTNNLEYVGPVIEEYVTDPMTETNPNKWLTRVIYLVK